MDLVFIRSDRELLCKSCFLHLCFVLGVSFEVQLPLQVWFTRMADRSDEQQLTKLTQSSKQQFGMQFHLYVVQRAITKKAQSRPLRGISAPFLFCNGDRPLLD